MTDYEYASLFVGFLEAQNAVFANYATIVFAMLTVSWFVARRLDTTATVLLLGIYTLWSFSLIQAMWAAFGDFARLGFEIHQRGIANDTALGWLGPLYAQDAIGYMNALPNIVLGMAVLVYIASIIFFFRVRYRKGADGDMLPDT